MNDFEFERGREAGLKWGERLERERIIKLLVPIRQRNQGKGFEEEIVADTLGEVIALIKGENTDKAIVHTSTDNAITDTQGENK